MKIAITGHTSGIGLGLSRVFKERGHEVTGFSRSTGDDISNHEALAAKIIEGNFDLVILNAHAAFATVMILYALAEQWADDPSKTVVTISSMASDGIARKIHRYAIAKGAIDKSVEQMQYIAEHKNGWRVINIRPGWVDTPRVAHIQAKKLSVEKVVETILWAIDQPPDVLICSITLRAR